MDYLALKRRFSVFLTSFLIIAPLTPMILAFTQDKTKENLKKEFYPVLFRHYVKLLNSQELRLTSLDILDIKLLTEKTDSLYSLKLVNMQLKPEQVKIERLLEKLAVSSTIINSGKALSVEVYNQALKQSQADLERVEPLMKSFTALSNKATLLQAMIKSSKLDSIHGKGYTAIFNLRAHDEKYIFNRDSITVTFNRSNILRTGPWFTVDTLKELSQKNF